jgi:hypothetical protein
MANLSTASNDISSLIGALELGDHLTSLDDNVLEASAFGFAGPKTHDFGIGCTTRISDGALEAAGANMGWGPPTHVSLGNCTVLAGCVLSPPPR